MKFIFPKNYNFKNKLLGIIDYPTAIFNIVIFFIIFSISSLIFKDLTLKIFVIVLFYLPVFLISIIGFSNENILYILYYMIRYFIRPKLYLYKKQFKNF